MVCLTSVLFLVEAGLTSTLDPPEETRPLRGVVPRNVRSGRYKICGDRAHEDFSSDQGKLCLVLKPNQVQFCPSPFLAAFIAQV